MNNIFKLVERIIDADPMDILIWSFICLGLCAIVYMLYMMTLGLNGVTL